LFYFL